MEADLDGPCEHTRSRACRRPERACGGDLRRGPLLAGGVDRGPASSSYPVAAHPGLEWIEQCSARRGLQHMRDHGRIQVGCEGQRGAHHDPVIPTLDVWLFSAGLIVTSSGSPGPKDQATRACCGLCWSSVRVSRAHATWGPIQRALVALRGIACHRVRTTISRSFVRSRMT